MGHSISAETAEKLHRNRMAERLCQGGARHCTTRASVAVTSTVDSYNDGRFVSTSTIKFCTRHAKPYAPGFVGQNFVVDAVEKF